MTRGLQGAVVAAAVVAALVLTDWSFKSLIYNTHRAIYHLYHIYPNSGTLPNRNKFPLFPLHVNQIHRNFL